MDEQTIANIYQAYLSGVMSPDEAAQYEADVNAGVMQIPAGAQLKTAIPQAQTPTTAPATEALPMQQEQPVQQTQQNILDQGIINAYSEGRMTPEEMQQLEEDVASGVVSLPQGEELAKPEEPGILSSIYEQITGEQRSTPEVESLPDWATMPELNELSLDSFKSAAGTLMTSPDETVKIIKSNYPGVDVRQDEKGNYILKSSVDNKEYAIKPGFRVSDIPRLGSVLAAFTPAGRATTLPGQVVGAAATQSAIEGAQAATGGEFNPAEVALSAVGAGTGFLGGKAISGVSEAAKKGLQKLRGVAPSAVEKAAPMAAEELATTAKKAAEGGITGKGSKQILAEQAMPDQQTIEAARRLGIDEYLQPDHVSTNQAYRELAQAVKSVPGSKARAAELEGYRKIAEKADDLVEELGGTQDFSKLDITVRSKMESLQSQLEGKADKMYSQLREAIPAKTEAPADNLLTWISNRSDELGGDEFLSPMEKRMKKALSPTAEGAQPTYARLDDVRKSLTAARVKKEGVFKDADTGLIKKLEGELLKDQQAVAERAGVSDLFNTARKTVAVRKGLEDDMKALFGKNLQGTIIGDLSGSVKKLSSGDVSKFIGLVNAVPKSMRQEVVASGLNTAFGKSARNGQLNFTNYAKWYEGLRNNQKAYTALMANLPKGAQKKLDDLYKVSNGIRMASKERITTGRLQAVREELRGADSLVGNIYDLAKRSAVGMAAEAITTPLGVPGAGLAAGISSALTKGKTDALKAADDLITSPEFIRMASEGTEEAARKMAATSQFKKFFTALGKPREMSNPEQWLLKAFQAERQMTEENK